jgi:hypothetical protein
MGVHDPGQSEALGRPVTTSPPLAVHRVGNFMQQSMEASETLRRALASAEEAFGPSHPLTMDIVMFNPVQISGQPGESFCSTIVGE